jgi:hypothetical protein
MISGVTHDPVEKTKEAYPAKFVYQDTGPQPYNNRTFPYIQQHNKIRKENFRVNLRNQPEKFPEKNFCKKNSKIFSGKKKSGKNPRTSPHDRSAPQPQQRSQYITDPDLRRKSHFPPPLSLISLLPIRALYSPGLTFREGHFRNYCKKHRIPAQDFKPTTIQPFKAEITHLRAGKCTLMYAFGRQIARGVGG